MDERIKMLRKNKKLTQQEFANKIGTSRANVAGYETGTRVPSNAVISLICKEFCVNEEWLRNGTGEMFLEKDRLQAISEFAATMVKEPESFKSRFVEGMSKLDEKDWIELEKIFDKILEKKQK